ncbi:hypothetical protein E4U30_003326 [Claviceps sp. LM220 group G6]|nr:hypothetical protein E4U30_003326 [Claviceps sp. LM220 group G6]
MDTIQEQTEIALPEWQFGRMNPGMQAMDQDNHHDPDHLANLQNNGWQVLDVSATAVWAIRATARARQAADFMVDIVLKMRFSKGAIIQELVNNREFLLSKEESIGCL